MTIEEMKKLAEGATDNDFEISFSEQLKCPVVWNGDGDALAGFYGGYSRNGDYVEGENDAKFYTASRTFAPEAIEVMEKMAEALEIAREIKCNNGQYAHEIFGELDRSLAAYRKIGGV